MKSFLYRWLWEGRQKWLVLFSFISLCLWVGAYASWELIGKSICSAREAFAPVAEDHEKCTNLYLFSIHNPFFFGYFLKSLIIAPLLILPFSKIVFKSWLVFSLVCIPAGLFFIFATGIYSFLDKLGMSDLWGIIYFLGTLAIILLVPLAEWFYKKYKVKK